MFKYNIGKVKTSAGLLERLHPASNAGADFYYRTIRVVLPKYSDLEEGNLKVRISVTIVL